MVGHEDKKVVFGVRVGSNELGGDEEICPKHTWFNGTGLTCNRSCGSRHWRIARKAPSKRSPSHFF